MKKNDTELEHGSGNVYRDLGFPDPDDMLLKAQLVSAIDEILRSGGMTRAEASRVLGIRQPKLASIFQGHFHDVSAHKLMECLNKLGRDVEIVVKPARAGDEKDTFSVVFV